ncbi:MAG TPA: PadR family transcriptional regulator [Acidimicrobiales bacterium]|jgi:DNA-binding PadR family transcriptional regulator
MSRVFSHGRLRLFLLLLLAERPNHGYELIRLLEDRFLGLYTPSAGTIYPRLAALEEEGLVEHDEIEGRKVYRLTDNGRAELEAHRHELRDLEARAAESARHMAHEIRHEVKASVRELRQELGVAMRDLRREERRTAREAAKHRRGDHRGHDDRGDEADAPDAPDRLVLRSLSADLDAFVTDVMTAARRQPMDSDRLRAVREGLLAAREAVIGALSGNRPPSA